MNEEEEDGGTDLLGAVRVTMAPLSSVCLVMMSHGLLRGSTSLALQLLALSSSVAGLERAAFRLPVSHTHLQTHSRSMQTCIFHWQQCKYGVQNLPLRSL